MQRTLNSVVWIVCCAAPLFFALSVISWKRRKLRSQRHHPFRELRRRPAGESLRLKLVELDDKLFERVFVFVGIPAICWTAGQTIQRSGWLLPTLAFLASSVWATVFGHNIYRIFRERSDYLLGF